MTIRVQSAVSDSQWIRVNVEDLKHTHVTVAIDRSALESVIQTDPRPPEIILDVLCERAIKRMPVPNGADGVRLITPHNLSLVWPH